MSEPRRKNGDVNPEAMDAMVGAMSGAALAPLALSRSLAEEGLKFWARRLHAYAVWAEAASQSRSPQQMLDAQSAFLAQIQQDYVQESAAVAEIVTARMAASDKAPPT